MRLKLPWQRDKGISKSASAQKTADALAEEDFRKRQHLRGEEILESEVETVELGALAKLPPFKPIVISLVRLFDREDVKVDEVATMIQADPSLTSELLAIVNSPLFGFPRPIASIAHGISLMGSDRTRSLAATLAMRSLMQGGPRTPIVRRFWIHSIATATIARQFAPVFRVEPELAHVCAMMHDLGRNGLLAAHQEEYAQIAVAAHESTEQILAAEQAAFGMDHCQAGSMLARAWRLPAPFQAVARLHHDLESKAPIVSLIQLSCRLADDLMYQSIHRHDTQKPEDTIEQRAPEPLREQLLLELETIGEAIDKAISTLDF